MSWRTVALGDVCKVIAGQSPEGKYYNNDGVGIPFYQGKKDFGKVYINPPSVWTTEITKEAIKDDILMSVRAPVGPVNISRENICIGRGLAAIRSSEKIDKSYLFNYLLSIEKDLIGSSGAVFNSINKGQIEKLEIPLPPLSTQQKIVAKIDAIFAEIGKATAAAEANAKNAEALFQSYMSKTFAECESLYSLSQLITICDLQNGYAFKSADYIEYSETLNIRMSSIRPGGFFDAEHNKRYLPDSYAEKYKEFLLKEGDLVIAMTDMAGDPKILGVPTIVKNLNGRRFLMNQRVGKLHKFSDSIHVPYLRYFLTSPKIKEFYKNKGDGGLQINISKKDILSAEIPLPPLSIQEKIGKEMTYVQSHYEISKNRYYKKINEYIALKQSILNQAFTGELVKE